MITCIIYEVVIQVSYPILYLWVLQPMISLYRNICSSILSSLLRLSFLFYFGVDALDTQKWEMIGTQVVILFYIHKWYWLRLHWKFLIDYHAVDKESCLMIYLCPLKNIVWGNSLGESCRGHRLSPLLNISRGHWLQGLIFDNGFMDLIRSFNYLKWCLSLACDTQWPPDVGILVKHNA